MDRFLNDDIHCAQLVARLNAREEHAKEEDQEDQQDQEEGRVLVQPIVAELAFDFGNLNEPLSAVGD
jgi:hypothetical protein